MASKRIRPRPNLVIIDLLTPGRRGKLNMLADFHREPEEIPNVSRVIRNLVDEAWETIETIKQAEKKSSRNSKN